MSVDRKAPLSEHLNELAKRLKVVFYSLIATTIVIMALPGDLNSLNNPFAFYTPLISIVFKRVTHDIMPPQFVLVGYTVGSPIELYLLGSFVLAVLINIPIIAYEVYKYVHPALYENEKEAVGPFVVSFTILFIIGAIFGYFFLAPFTMYAMIPFFAAVGAQPYISVNDFYGVVFAVVLMSGVTFTFPVFLVLLVRLKIMSITVVTKNRKYIYAALLVITAVITPDGGPIADFALFIPLLFLLEIAVLVAKRYETEGLPTTMRWFQPDAKCRFCSWEMARNERFCRRCGKSQG
jgi:sec-independent protein translocase protein TatC